MELLNKSPDISGSTAHYNIETKNISYKLPKQVGWFFCREITPSRYILRNVNCEARAGEIMAIAGPSGAGKTTLLEVLAGAIPWSKVSGDVLVNDQQVNVRYYKRLSGYVTQDDSLFPLLTVRETLTYSAYLRLDGCHQKAKARVEKLLKELGLEHVACESVGGQSNRGISGGERRRVSIGIELVHDPAVLLLDEPTSGLDSTSALQVALLLKSMAAKDMKTIVLTIHQPGFRILQLIDQVLLLSNGAVIHRGSLHLLEQKLVLAGHYIPQQVNALEFAIESIEAQIIAAVDRETEDISTNRHVMEDSFQENKVSYSKSPFSEILTLSQRFSKNICRTKELFTARIIQSILAGIALGSIFINASCDPKKPKVQTQIGFFAFTLTFLVSSTAEGLPIYLQERRILMRETSRGAYRISSYVISNALVYLPFLLAVTLMYTTPVYWLVGLRREIDGFLYFSLVLYMVVLMSNSFISCFSALVPNFITGTSIISGVMGAFFLFSGFFIPKKDIPNYWMFMHYLSLFKYPLESLMINEYGGEQGRMKCLKFAEGQCILTGDMFLVQQGLKEPQKWSNLCVMLSFFLGYRFLCFIILQHRSSKTRS